MTNALLKVVNCNLAGETMALPSICSAQPDVILASALLAKEKNAILLLEATSNQVNQDGGYTGMKPADFVAYTQDICTKAGLPWDRVLLGGDHLGPQAWRHLPAAEAMAKAEELMAAYVSADFTKIHLDCSEGCAGEPAQVGDEVSAARAAQLAVVCERHAPDASQLNYIVGTEVPPPGGAREEGEAGGIEPTPPERAQKTLEMHFAAFAERGLQEASKRICGLVVQPGVEFSPFHIDHLPEGDGAALRAVLDKFQGVVFEAHSTDYQRDDAYMRLAQMGFAIQKVGPALTFAYRQALYALDAMRDWLCDDKSAPPLADVMEEVMCAEPKYWHSHYHGDAKDLKLLRHFSYADRIRYYWPTAAAQEALSGLLADLIPHNAPETLKLQYFDKDVVTRAETLAAASRSWAHSLVLAQIQSALLPYFFEVNLSQRKQDVTLESAL